MRDINDVPEWTGTEIVTPLGQTVFVTQQGTVQSGPGRARLITTTSGESDGGAAIARWYRAALVEITNIDVALDSAEKCMHMRRIARLALGQIPQPNDE